MGNLERLNFWTEQYLLQAFLSFNEKFEVLLCNSYLGLNHLQLLKDTFPTSPMVDRFELLVQTQA